MIAILGSHEDDLLYLSEFADSLSEEKTLPCGGKYRLGKIAGVDVLLGIAGETSYLTAIYCAQLFALYPIPTLIKVGDGIALDPDFELGDSVYVQSVYPHAVNYHADGLRYGEMPGGIPSVLPLDRSYEKILEEAGYPLKKGSCLSGEKAIYEKGEFEGIMKRRFLYLDKMGIYDPSAYGVALACHLHQCSLLMLETVSFILGDEEGRVTKHRVALENEVKLGHLVCFLLEGGKL